MANLRGEGKVHFEALLSQYGEAQHLLEEKGAREREDANEIASLTITLEEEHELRVSCEEKLDNIEESHNAIVAKLIKERDFANAKYKVLKKEKIEFGLKQKDQMLIALQFNVG